ncbi:MAG TPA: ABC-2 family transporter protein [Candidatus Limnocylindrales bacterium]|nr:ABC-2 family transporter protein [Candidatus Limnocylindrales bacterium]
MSGADRGMVRLALRITYAYRVSVLTTAGLLVVEVFLLRMIWTSVYGGQSSVDGFRLDALIVYLTLVNLQMFLMTTPLAAHIHSRVRTGVVFFDFVRPIGYPRQMLGIQAGTTLGQASLLLPAIPVAFLAGAISAPADAVAALAYVVSLILGYGIAVLLALLLGMAAFWTIEINGITLFYRFVSQFFAGTMIPLTFFPGPLRTLADLLPFRFLGYVPAAIYVGVLDQAEIPRTLATQAVWMVVLAGLFGLTWRRAQRRLVVQGG